MQFIRRPARENSSLMVSVCRYCHEFVAAGTSEEQLAIIERMHRCRARPPRRAAGTDVVPDR
jgi:hypothetical protein